MFDAVNTGTHPVMQSCVSQGVPNTYENRNVNFFVWLFDNREHYGALLKPRPLKELKLQHK